jgi:hypothetical protein
MCRVVAVYVETMYSLYYVTSDEGNLHTKCSMSGLIGTLQTQKCTKPWAVSYEGRQLPNSTLYFKLSVDNNYQHLIKLARR